MTRTAIVPANRSLYLLIAALMALATAVQVARDRGWQPYVPESGIMWIRSGPLAQRLALSFDNLVSDIYWMRAVVYFGGQRDELGSRRNFDQLFPLLDLVTALDPYFRVGYRFGSLFLAEPPPGGPGRPDQAIELLKKGLERDPARWEYAHDIAFVYYWWLDDYTQAAEWFKRAADIPGSAPWLRPMAAITLAEGGNRQSSRTLWTEMYANTEIEWIRTSAERRLQQLDAMDAIDELNRATQRFIAQVGRPPANWPELAKQMRFVALPTDPTGVPFDLDPQTGQVTLSPKSTLWPLPVGASVRNRQ
jgi:tetratricopeptide (TPR) repeat protein